MTKEKKWSKPPNTLVLIFSIIIITAALTWIIPGGTFERQSVDGRDVLIAESFKQVENVPQGIGAVLLSPIRGFMAAIQIIAFIFIVGGAFSVLQKTGAIHSLIISITKAQEKNAIIRSLIIPVLMILFSAFGSLFGMSEEIIPFILIFVPLAISLGYDSIVGVAVPFLGAGVGFASAFINPFTLGIAQGIAELPPLSGITYRIICWAIFTSISILFVVMYARKIRKNPQSSNMYKSDQHWRDKEDAQDRSGTHHGLSRQNLFVLLTFGFTILTLIIGVILFGWYINEITGLFLAMAFLVGAISQMGPSKIAESFVEGTKDFMTVAFIIALARAILIIAEDGRIIDTILYALSNVVREAHPIIAAQSMFLVQSVINVFIPSGSGQAALIMPLMTPLSDLVGVTRQTAVLAFQMGDGLTNMIIPTSGVTMGVLGLARVPFEKWFIWMAPLMIFFYILGFLLLIPPVLMQWGPF